MLLGYDIGSSSVKACLLDPQTGRVVAEAFAPDAEQKIRARRPAWAEQDPEDWWINLKKATCRLKSKAGKFMDSVKAIGLSYQMHGLVLVGHDHRPLRPAIIWCDSRAVEIGSRAFSEIGPHCCLDRLLNSPGNFTASKLKWVMDNEPDIYNQTYKAMLPGDYIALRMTGEDHTTPSGLSEWILWDYQEQRPSRLLLDHYGIKEDLIPKAVEPFSFQGRITEAAAGELGLPSGISLTYRAGDQPNNAFSLGVLQPGECAATAGTSGVIYGIEDTPDCDPKSRVNVFLHVNHQADAPRYGVLLCINGCGIANHWLKNHLSGESLSYDKLNALAAQVPPGADGLSILPFGNGAERILDNTEGAAIHGLNFNIHSTAHLARAVQEGIVFSMRYGVEILKKIGIDPVVIKAGDANLFKSPLFRETFAACTGCPLEILSTDGAQGAARGAGIASGAYKGFAEAFGSLRAPITYVPDAILAEQLQPAYAGWVDILENKKGGIYEST